MNPTASMVREALRREFPPPFEVIPVRADGRSIDADEDLPDAFAIQLRQGARTIIGMDPDPPAELVACVKEQIVASLREMLDGVL